METKKLLIILIITGFLIMLTGSVVFMLEDINPELTFLSKGLSMSLVFGGFLAMLLFLAGLAIESRELDEVEE